MEKKKQTMLIFDIFWYIHLYRKSFYIRDHIGLTFASPRGISVSTHIWSYFSKYWKKLDVEKGEKKVVDKPTNEINKNYTVRPLQAAWMKKYKNSRFFHELQINCFIFYGYWTHVVFIQLFLSQKQNDPYFSDYTKMYEKM